MAQINLKFNNDFYDIVKHYSNIKGYMNIQELVREALRDKIFGDLDVKDEYVKILNSKEANDFLSVDDSKDFLNKLKNRLK